MDMLMLASVSGGLWCRACHLSSLCQRQSRRLGGMCGVWIEPLEEGGGFLVAHNAPDPRLLGYSQWYPQAMRCWNMITQSGPQLQVWVASPEHPGLPAVTE